MVAQNTQLKKKFMNDESAIYFYQNTQTNMF